MFTWIKTFFSGAGIFLSALGTYWQKRQKEKALAEAQDIADRIGADPVDVWMSTFNPDKSSDTGTETDTGKSEEK